MNITATIIEHQQGSDAWLQHRARSLNASELAAVMGMSSYATRADILKQKSTGIVPEVDAATQRRFDDGHRFEGIARGWAEQMIGEDLYPVVLAAEVDGLPLSASLDGQTMTGEITFEHKTGRADLLASLEAGAIPDEYHPQLEQGLLLSGASRCLFMASSGDRQTMRFAWYESRPDLRAKIIPTWKQFASDLAAYSPREAAPAAPVGHAPESLPALRIELSGAVTASNLAEFKATALGAIRSVNRELSTDAHFADAKEAVKWCSEVESRIKAAKEHALSQTATIDELFKTLDDVSAEARKVRLDLEKLVARREVEIKGELVSQAKAAYEAHEAACRQDAGAWTLIVPPDFGAAIKGKRSVDSMRDALDVALAKGKIAASEQASKIRANLAALDDESKGSEHLFRDRLTFIGLTPEAVRLMVRQRIAEHRAAEEKRAAELAERERERIRAEEAAKARAEQEALALQERQRQEAEARERRQREESEAQARQQAQAPAPTQPPAAAPIAPPAVSSQADNVVPLGTRAPADTGARLRLGEVNARLAPITLTADGLASLGFHPVATDKAAKLYRASDLGLICAALVKHLSPLMAASKQVAA